MASPLAGSLTRTIGKALAPVFLPATLTRGAVSYSCRAIFEKWAKYPGSGGSITAPNVKALVLANSLSIEPQSADTLTVQGFTFLVTSHQDTKFAVSTDPARAVWTLLGNLLPLDPTGATGTSPTTIAANAAALGLPYRVFRSAGSNPLLTTSVQTTPVIVTSAKAAGYSYTRSSTYDDVLFALQADFTNIQIGDYLVGPAGTLFIADMPSLRPVVAVLCNTTVSVTRPGEQLSSTGGQAPGLPSQPGKTRGTYWAPSTKPTTDLNGPGEVAIKFGIPASMIGTTGRATGVGELPSDAPGPSRWRVYVPQSAFPKGTIKDRDILTDDQGERLQVSADYFSTIGYRIECVRLEN